ncbi:fusion protein [Mallotus japonicus virus B]|nr:fusion protein [Mallotus japonicus virus B]
MAFAGLDGGRQGLGAGGGNVPQAPRNLNDYHGIASDAEQTAKIQAEIQILTEHHVRIDQFTCAAVTAAGLTADQFIKLARVFTSVADQQMRVQLLSLGTRRSCWALHDQMTVKQFIGFCKFLKTGEGQKATHSAQRTLKLERKAGTTYQPSDIALVNVLTTQLQDMANVVKQTREEYDRQISELRLQIRQLEEQKEKSLRKAMRKFKPACFFKEPSRDEFNLECYSRYEREAQAKGRVAIPAGDIGFAHATTHFGNEVRQHHLSNFVKQEEYRQSLTKYLKDKILQFEQRGEHRQTEIFGTTWQSSLERRLLMLPLKQRRLVLTMIPVGKPVIPQRKCLTQQCLMFLDPKKILRKGQFGGRRKPLLAPGAILPKDLRSDEIGSTRIRVMKDWAGEKPRKIPISRSKWEAGVRKIIGGGEMRNWASDSSMYRGGGNSSDALLLLSQARCDTPGTLLEDFWTVTAAREALTLPSGLHVPSGPDCVSMKHFNNDATAGPFLRAHGIKRKYGLKGILEDFMWQRYRGYADGRWGEAGLPHFTARLGFRTKLVTEGVALKKLGDGAPIGRAVMMLDALEQAASSPLYNVLSAYTHSKRLERSCGFKNAVVKASADWAHIWEYVREADYIAELDWSKFDRERPKEDISFVIQIVLSCFQPKDQWEERLLRAYGICMRRALIERLLILDSGGIIAIDGMVPSGSLWTGWLDTALNILYIKAACLRCFIPLKNFSVLCAGDDNLTIFKGEPVEKIQELRGILNSEFRAGIEADDFFVHKPPFFVRKFQACFPPGTDLTKGTSRILSYAQWVEFTGELSVSMAAGKSHRWEYRFAGCPKFLSNYWLEDGRPIRPAHDNLEKLLWPEGIHDSIEKYEAAVIAMVVDNPFNHHNVNHMLMRYVIIQQIRRYGGPMGDLVLCMWAARFRADQEGYCPFPMIAPWRKVSGHARMEDYIEVQPWIDDFRDFMRRVSTLYLRRAEGGVDAWQFMDVIRGEAAVGEGQFGNDLRRWMQWLYDHPVSRSLKPTRTYKEKPQDKTRAEQLRGHLSDCFTLLGDLLDAGAVRDCMTFAEWITTRYGVRK